MLKARRKHQKTRKEIEGAEKKAKRAAKLALKGPPIKKEKKPRVKKEKVKTDKVEKKAPKEEATKAVAKKPEAKKPAGDGKKK
jgi:hypothetical protein